MAMKAVQINEAKDWEIIEKEIPEPNASEVRIKVAACGVCHSDQLVKEGHWPGITFPRIPGHEVAGVIDAVGPNVNNWKKGQRVGVGWAGKICRECISCRHGDFMFCQKQKITGVHLDGGYEEYMIAPVEALAAIPDELTFAEAAPLLCAGITTFNALRHSHARPGDIVAIQGIGGLGHLGIQFANKMGFKTVAISHGADKEALAKKLGAHIYLNTDNENAVAALQKLGGAQAILATAPSGKAIAPLVEGLANHGYLMAIGATQDPIEFTSVQLIQANRCIMGWSSGTAIDSEETMKFCALTGIRPMIEKFPLEKAPDAYNHMLSNKVRFRAVLTLN